MGKVSDHGHSARVLAVFLGIACAASDSTPQKRILRPLPRMEQKQP
jgi:hypothetical protein